MSLPPWPFLPMGIGEQHCDCLAFVTFDLGDALAGQRLDLAMPSPRRRLMLTLTPTLTLTLTLSTPGYGTVHKHIRNMNLDFQGYNEVGLPKSIGF